MRHNKNKNHTEQLRSALAALLFTTLGSTAMSQETFTWTNNAPGNNSWRTGGANANYPQSWNVSSNWVAGAMNVSGRTFANAPGDVANFNMTNDSGILPVIMAQDITVGQITMTETINNSIYIGSATAAVATPETPTRTFVMDSGVNGTGVTWARTKTSGVTLRMEVYSNLRLDSDLTTTWQTARDVYVHGAITGAGQLTFNESFDSSSNNAQVIIGPAASTTVVNTYSGGTVINSGATLDTTRNGYFIAAKNKALGSGHVTITGVNATRLQLHEIGALDDMIDDSATVSLSVGVNDQLAMTTGVSETISDLFIGGVLQPAGNYTSSASAFITPTGFNAVGGNAGVLVSVPYQELLTSSGNGNWAGAANWVSDGRAGAAATPSVNGRAVIQGGNTIVVGANSFARRVELTGTGSKLTIAAGNTLDTLNLVANGGNAAIASGGIVGGNGTLVEIQAGSALRGRFVALSGDTTMAAGSTLQSTEVLTLGNLSMTGATVDAGTAVVTINPRSTVNINAASTFTVSNLAIGAGSTVNYNIASPMSLDYLSGAGNLNLNGQNLTLGGVGAASGESQGVISGANFTKTGTGVTTLRGANTYTGTTTVNSGILAFGSIGNIGATSSALGAPTAGNDTISMAAGTTLRYVGSELTGHSSNRPISMGATGTIDQSGNGLLTLTGSITGATTSLTKAGTGTLSLSTAQTYTGSTIITGGALRAVSGTGLPTNSLLTLNGGVLESSGTFSRPLGNTAGTNSVNWPANGSGGFAANGGKLTVTLAGAPNPLLWGSAGSTANFVNGTGTLVLGSITADNEVELTQNIQLVGTTNRTIRVDDNTGSNADFATLSGVLSGTVSGVSLTKSGFGTLYLKNNNNSYIGKTLVSNGTLQFDSIANVGVGNVSALGAPETAANGTIDLGSAGPVVSATLKYTGTDVGGHSTDRVVRAINGRALSTLNASGVGPIKFTGGFTASATSGQRGIVLTGTNTGDNELGSISGVGATQLLKSGTGKWILTGANTHSGATIVSAGTLALGAGATLDSTSYIDVRAGATFDVTAFASGFNLNQNPIPAQTLSGLGTVLGKVNVGTGTFVSPGIGVDDLSNSTAALATNVGELTFTDNLSIDGTYRWNLGALTTTLPGTNFDSIKLTGGALTLGATSQLALGFSLLGLNDPNSADPFWTTPGTKTWKIIDITGTATNTTNFGSIDLPTWAVGTFNTTLGTGADLGDVFLNYVVPSVSSIWQGAISGDNWTAAGSWSGSVPNSVTAEAQFTTLGEPIANLDVDQTVNKLTFDATTGNDYTISGPGKLTLGGTTPSISLAATNTGDQTIATNVELGAGTTITVSGGSLSLNVPTTNAVLGAGVSATVATGATLNLGGAGNALSNGTTTHANVANSGTLTATTAGKRVGEISGSGTTTVTAAGATLTANHIRQSTLNIGAGNTVTVASNGGNSGTSTLTNLNINATGKLDLNDNDLVVDNGNLTTLTAKLATGLDINGTYGNGPGITSSAFASNPNFNTVLGIAANVELGYTSFSGQTVDTNDVLIKYTYYGDADLSGSVDTSTDFDLYITGLTSGGSLGGWLYGDFDYSGTVDSSTDFDLYITGLTTQGGALLTGGGGNLVQAVPEPSTFVLGGLALLGFAGAGVRKRRLKLTSLQ